MFYGKLKCNAIKGNGKKCTNGGYYKTKMGIRCGVHSKNGQRTKLPRDPDEKNKRKVELENMMKSLSLFADKNENKGKVIVSKMYMMKKVNYVENYLCVFPNFKHDNRADGFGCSELSPKSMGPINHDMPNLPPAKNLENYHQFAKVFKFEINENKVTPEAMAYRIKGYKDTTPHRHKYDRKMLNEKNVNIPEFSVYYNKEGEERRFNYLQCRYFYCYWYEKIAKETESFKKLKHKLNNGYNLNIVGYDGYNVEKPLMECYLDISRPFGHELVLYTMLTVDEENDFPWNVYYKENKDLYDGFI